MDIAIWPQKNETVVRHCTGVVQYNKKYQKQHWKKQCKAAVDRWSIYFIFFHLGWFVCFTRYILGDKSGMHVLTIWKWAMLSKLYSNSMHKTKWKYALTENKVSN